jgi:hypothetical protein
VYWPADPSSNVKSTGLCGNGVPRRTWPTSASPPTAVKPAPVEGVQLLGQAPGTYDVGTRAGAVGARRLADLMPAQHRHVRARGDRRGIGARRPRRSMRLRGRDGARSRPPQPPTPSAMAATIIRPVQWPARPVPGRHVVAALPDHRPRRAAPIRFNTSARTRQVVPRQRPHRQSAPRRRSRNARQASV